MAAAVAGLAVWYLVATQKQPVITAPLYEPGQIIADCETCPSLVVLAVKPSAQSAAGPTGAAMAGCGPFEVTLFQYARFIAETGAIQNGPAGKRGIQAAP